MERESERERKKKSGSISSSKGAKKKVDGWPTTLHGQSAAPLVALATIEGNIIDKRWPVCSRDQPRSPQELNGEGEVAPTNEPPLPRRLSMEVFPL